MKKLPEFEEIKKGIDELILEENWNKYKVLKNPNRFYSSVEKKLINKLKIIPRIIDLQNSNNFPFKFYRIRKKNKEFDKSLIYEYSHPPVHLTKIIQRANLPKHPVFYCSDNPGTAISELLKTTDKIDKNEEYYLSEWELLPNKEYNLSPFFFGNLNKNSFYEKWSESNYLRLKNTMIKNGFQGDYESYKAIFEFLSNLFVHENSYIVSSFIAHTHLYANDNFRTDIFVYPSVQLDNCSVNYAIHPNAVLEKMRLKKVFVMNFSEFIRKEKIKYTLTEIGENKNSIIHWSKDMNNYKKEIIEIFKPDIKDEFFNPL